MVNLDGKRVLVTGAGIGIGQGIAIALAREGAAVAAHYAHSLAGARATIEQITSDGGSAALVAGNLRSAAECVRVVEEAAAALGGLDLLVNNAGVTRTAPITELTEETYDELFDLNVKAYYFCAKPLLDHCRANGT